MARKRRNARPYLNFVPALRVSQLDIASRLRLEADRRRAIALEKLRALHAAYMAEIEDRRRFDPDPRSRSPRDRRSRVAKISSLSLLGSNQFFSDAYTGALPVSPAREGLRPTEARAGSSSRVIICVRRKVRREVMFAKGRAGGRVSRRRRRNQFSNVFC